MPAEVSHEAIDRALARWGMSVDARGRVFHNGQEVGSLGERGAVTLEGFGVEAGEVQAVRVDPAWALQMVRAGAFGTVRMSNDYKDERKVTADVARTPLPFKLNGSVKVRGVRFGRLVAVLLEEVGSDTDGSVKLLNPSDGHVTLGGNAIAIVPIFRGFPCASVDMRVDVARETEQDFPQRFGLGEEIVSSQAGCFLGDGDSKAQIAWTVGDGTIEGYFGAEGDMPPIAIAEDEQSGVAVILTF